jgi:Ca2+ regulator and membrane fusion protein Fig1
MDLVKVPVRFYFRRLTVSAQVVFKYLTPTFLHYNMLIRDHAYRLVALPLAFLCLLLLMTFPGWHTEEVPEGSEAEPAGPEIDVKPFPSRPVSQISLSFVAISSILSFISLLWQHVASAVAATATENLSYGSVKSHVGASAMVLGWVGVALIMVVTIGLLAMVLSIRLLAELEPSEPEAHTTADRRTQSQGAAPPQPPQPPQQMAFQQPMPPPPRRSQETIEVVEEESTR